MAWVPLVQGHPEWFTLLVTPYALSIRPPLPYYPTSLPTISSVFLPFPGFKLRITLGYLWEAIRNFLKLMMALVTQFRAYANTRQAMNI